MTVLDFTTKQSQLLSLEMDFVQRNIQLWNISLDYRNRPDMNEIIEDNKESDKELLKHFA